MTADQDVLNLFNGSNGTQALPEALVSRFYDAHIFGLSKDYAHPEGANTTSSRFDSITSMDKLLTRKRTHVDGNSYDAWDALQTILKSVLAANPHINDDEVNSVNYKKPTP
jgi:hypothetical protein